GRAKRSNTWELSISTAGWDPETLLHRLYQLGKSGEDERFLFVWYEADAGLDLETRDDRMAAIRQANPAVGDFLQPDGIEARFHEIPEHEWRRYYLNQWVSAPEQWIDEATWESVADRERVVPPATDVSIGFDGSYNQDSTALVGCTLHDPHLFTIGVWERPELAKEWVVPEHEVEDAILDACATYNVRSLPADDTFGRIWSKLLNALHEKGVPVVEWPTRSPSRMAPACGELWGTIRRGEITHDADPRLTAHVMNSRTKTDRFGPRIVKEHRGSTKHIDAAVAAVIARDMAVRLAGERRPAWLLND
ncbi:MAG: terminase large subunit, partial [Acidobacteriota bacterium]|nr:terminase large subunit [Acidobacteriota bacterium]